MPSYDPNQVSRAFNKLFSIFPLPTAASSPEEATRAYLEVCEGYSTADVEYVLKQFQMGNVQNWNPSFAPTTAVLSQELRRFDDEKRKWDHLDHALHLQLEGRVADEKFIETKTPESRARVKAIVDDAVASLTKLSEAENAESKANRMAMMKRTNERFDRERYSAGDPDGRDD